MLRKPPKRGKVPCGVCQGPVVDGKDEALLCEGECGLWFHRGCASVPPSRYKVWGKKDLVDGARRIWNTMPTCSARAVATTIAKLFPAKLDLQVKRKTKRLANKTLWWFVVHGSEGDLTLLERDWEKVQHQTLWSLQNCFMSPNKDDGREMHPPPLSLQEPTLPSAGSSSPSPSLLNQDHQAPSETSTSRPANTLRPRIFQPWARFSNAFL